MNAVIYVRLERWEYGNALLLKRVKQCRLWAEQNNFQVVRTFQDQPCNGKTLDRPGFTSLCEFLVKHQGYAIVVTDLAQLSCNRSDGEMLADVFDELYIEVYAVHEGRITPQRLMNAGANKPDSNGEQFDR